jgi:hypothetical protein
MKTNSEHNSDTDNVGKEKSLESNHSYCSSGHIVYWNDEPPSECPHCGASLLPNFYRKTSFPWLSEFKYG